MVLKGPFLNRTRLSVDQILLLRCNSNVTAM